MDRYNRADTTEETCAGSAMGSTSDEIWKPLTGSCGRQTLHAVLFDLAEKGPTVRDRQVL